MRNRLVILLIALGIMIVPAMAQDPPAYTIFFIARQLSADNTTVEAEFLVANNGGDATQSTQVSIRRLGEDTAIATSEIPPLATAGTHNLLLDLPLSSFGITEEQTIIFAITMTSPEFDDVRTLTEFTIPVPEAGIPTEPAAQPTSEPATETPTETGGGVTWIDSTRTQIEDALSFLPFDVDLTDRVQISVAVIVLIVLTILFWLFTVIIRVMFSSPATFPANPPPYAGVLQQHPDTLAGRRQMWQMVAQHGSMFAEESESNLHARKLLIGTDNVRYSGWKVIGLRTSQYDSYGRIAKSQVIAENKHLRRLSNVIDRATDLTPQQVERRVKPTASYLAKQLGRRINKRTAALPITLDLKFRGIHGEVSIIFELYQYQSGAWRRLDGWQPEMSIPGNALYEFYTYTIFGQSPGETLRQFKKRLRGDMIYLLTEMVLCTAPPPENPYARPAQAQPITRENIQPVQDIKPTTTSMRPVPPADTEEQAALMDTMMRTREQ